MCISGVYTDKPQAHAWSLHSQIKSLGNRCINIPIFTIYTHSYILSWHIINIYNVYIISIASWMVLMKLLYSAAHRRVRCARVCSLITHEWSETKLHPLTHLSRVDAARPTHCDRAWIVDCVILLKPNRWREEWRASWGVASVVARGAKSANCGALAQYGSVWV